MKVDRSIFPLLLAIFTRALPLTMFGPLLPGIARSLGADLAQVGWIVATYATGSLVAQPIMGRLSDVHGRRRILLWCVALFGFGSLVCVFSTSLWLLVAGRIIQALGAGGIQPVVTALVADRWPQESRGGALGAIYGMYGIGTMAGALLGGAIVDGTLWLAAHDQISSGLRNELQSYPWHIVFLVNVALAIVTYLSVATLPREVRPRRSTMKVDRSSQDVKVDRSGLDYPGIVLIAGFTFFIMLAATSRPLTAIAAGTAAAASLLGLFVWESKAKTPLFDPSLFRGGGKVLVYVIALAFGIPSFSLTIYSATYFIAQFNASEAQSGLALFGLAAAYVVGAIAGGQAVRHVGAKAPLFAGLAMAGAALLMLATLGSESAVIAAMALGGLGLGFASAPPNALLLQYASPSEAGGASGIAIMLATSGSITAPGLVSAFLHYGGRPPAIELRAEFAVGAAICAACAALAVALPRGKAP